jgi:hypothetical protein
MFSSIVRNVQPKEIKTTKVTVTWDDLKNIQANITKPVQKVPKSEAIEEVYDDIHKNMYASLCSLRDLYSSFGYLNTSCETNNITKLYDIIKNNIKVSLREDDDYEDEYLISNYFEEEVYL